MRRALPPLLVALLPVLALAGCLSAPPPPAGDLLPVDPATALHLLGEFQAASTSARTLRGVAQLRVTGSGGTRSGTQVLLVQAPDRLRTELLGPFGTPVLSLVIDTGELQALLPLDGAYYSGPASIENLAPLLRLPLQAEELIGLLLHRFALVSGEIRVFQTGAGGWQVHGGADGLREVLSFDASRHLTGIRRLADGRLLLAVEYAQFGKGDGFPRLVTVEVPGEASARLEFSEVELDAPLDDARFRITPPPNVRRFRLDEGVAVPVTAGGEG